MLKGGWGRVLIVNVDPARITAEPYNFPTSKMNRAVREMSNTALKQERLRAPRRTVELSGARLLGALFGDEPPPSGL